VIGGPRDHVLRRNELAAAGRTRWMLGDVLERQGVTAAHIARLELIYDEARARAHSERTVYLIHPLARPLPADGALGAW